MKNKSIRYKVVKIVIYGLFLSFIFGYVFKLFKTDGGSMEPSIKDGQYVLVNKIYYKINDHERFDVVILYDFENNWRLEKRLVGLPNETIEIKNGVFYINQKKIKDPYNTIPVINDFNYGPQKIPEDMFFYIGDSREDSVWGFCHKDDIIGKVMFH